LSEDVLENGQTIMAIPEVGVTTDVTQTYSTALVWHT